MDIKISLPKEKIMLFEIGKCYKIETDVNSIGQLNIYKALVKSIDLERNEIIFEPLV